MKEQKVETPSVTEVGHYNWCDSRLTTKFLLFTKIFSIVFQETRNFLQISWHSLKIFARKFLFYRRNTLFRKTLALAKVGLVPTDNFRELQIFVLFSFF